MSEVEAELRARVERLRKSHGIESARLREAKESLTWWLARAESAERARDAALAEVAGLRDRLAALADDMDERGRPGDGDSALDAQSRRQIREDAKRLRAALAPVTGDTEDASPAAEDVADDDSEEA